MPLEGTNGRRLKILMKCMVRTHDPAQRQTCFHKFIDLSLKYVAGTPIFAYNRMLYTCEADGKTVLDIAT
jgi:hypothetical protein